MLNPEKKSVWILLSPYFGPLGCQSVLEAKIEIPDTPVVNFAHASPAMVQDLLEVAVQCSNRMWDIQEMRQGRKKVPHDNNLLAFSPPPYMCAL